MNAHLIDNILIKATDYNTITKQKVKKITFISENIVDFLIE